MADAGDLEKLPIELRNKIYALILIKPDGFTLQNYKNGYQHYPDNKKRDHNAFEEIAPIPDHRNPKHRGQTPRLVRRKRRIESVHVLAHSDVELLRVNKKIFAEAAPMLYGGNKLTFRNVSTLGRFLDMINDEVKPHLRHVAITQTYQYRAAGSLSWNGGHAQARRSLRALAKAKGLRTLEVSHSDLCRNAPWPAPWADKLVGLYELATMCKPLLKALEVSFEKQNLACSVLNVIKIKLPHYVELYLEGRLRHDESIAGTYPCYCSMLGIKASND